MKDGVLGRSEPQNKEGHVVRTEGHGFIKFTFTYSVSVG